MISKLIQNINKKLSLISYNELLSKSILFSTPLEYAITKLKFWQPIDFRLLYKPLSQYAQRLLQYFLGAFNYWGINTIFKSYRELREELLISKYGINKAIVELSNLGLIIRKSQSYKNKSHWTISIIQFWYLGLRTFSAKVNQLLEVIYLKNNRSANSYSSKALDPNIDLLRLKNIAFEKLNCSFFGLKKIINTLVIDRFPVFTADYLAKWRDKVEESYQLFIKTPMTPNYRNKFEKKLPKIEEISEFERRERNQMALKRQEESNRAYIDKDPHGTFAKAIEVIQKAQQAGISIYEAAMLAMGKKPKKTNNEP